MPKSKNLKFEQIVELCEEKGINFVKKFVDILGGQNKNDIPFTLEEIKKQPTLDDFNFIGKQDYLYICQLEAIPIILDKKNKNWKNESIIAKNFKGVKEEKIFYESKGISYIFTANVNKKEHIVKIGASRKTFKERLNSYNCGVINNFRTASTTNIKILQSFIACAIPFNLYIFDCEEVIQFNLWGIQSVDFASPKCLAAEDIMIKQYEKQFGKLPLANVQGDADN